MALALPLLLAACSPQPDDSSADTAGAAPSAAPSASSSPSASGQGTDLFDDGIRETWSCIRLTEEGGSFTAYSR